MRGDLIPIRQWRILGCEHGFLVFVDPRRETIRIFEGMDENLGKVISAPVDKTDAWIQETLFPDAPSEPEVDGID